jgi:hypothetical protein
MVLVCNLYLCGATTHGLHRPTDQRKRVVPRALRKYCEEHQFLGPCCLCPLVRGAGEGPVFKEAAIYMPVFGRFKGEHVAECAKSECGYLGQSPFLLREN